LLRRTLLHPTDQKVQEIEPADCQSDHPSISNMIRSFFVLFLLSSFYFSNASSFAWVKGTDTIPSGKNAYRLGRKEFLENYGKDDSSRALINFYFTKRNRAITLTTIGGLESVVADILFNSVFTAGFAGTLSDLIVAYIGWTIVDTAGGVILVIGIISWLVFSRRKLLTILKNYFAGKSIPARIAKSRQFRKNLLFKRKSHG
jgi:hypothetical protein